MISLEQIIGQKKLPSKPQEGLNIETIINEMRRIVEMIQKGWERNGLTQPHNDEGTIRPIQETNI